MPYFLKTLNNGKNSVTEFCESVRQGIPLAVFGVPESFKYYLVSEINQKVLFVEKDQVTANIAKKAIEEFSGKKVVYVPPKDETLILRRAFSKDGAYSRISAISKIAEADVVIGTPESLMQNFPKFVRSVTIKKNDDIEIPELVSLLSEMGYKRTEKTEAKGTFSVRGDILDVYLIDGENPVRIDFFGDTVESIKEFDSETGGKIRFLESVTVLQAVEFSFYGDDVAKIKWQILSEVSNADRDQKVRLKTVSEDLIFAIENNDAESMGILSPLAKDSVTVFDLLGEDYVTVFDEPKRIREVSELVEREFTERFNALLKSGETFSFTKGSLIDRERWDELLCKKGVVALSALSSVVPYFNPLKIISPKVSGVANYRLDFKEVFNDILSWRRTGYNVSVYTESEKKAENFKLDLATREIRTVDASGNAVIEILPKPIENGFIFHEEKLAVIGSGNLYLKSVTARRIKNKKTGFFTAPTTGDYCVHEIHGVGRVLGNKKISTTEGTKDYIAVEYSGGDVLYIPVEQMDILTRYLGGEKKPKLSKIGGKDFERIKESVKESIKKMSFDLKKLYAEREKETGYRFNSEDELQTLFESMFPFSETPDQAVCDAEIKSDMQSDKVMDRLVCGDVGFGKTEVAFRAAFRAITCGKQVAMLAPTTILTEQHYNTAIKRFEGFGVRIACLNRFRKPKCQQEIVQDVKDGKIDFIIGTHRLLSKDVGFKDLGLLILDEEQRFGVEHKEKIKLLKKNVDAITLTATPIPRTLHLSLSGIRSISVINTPPKNRLPVQTYVTEETDTLIKDAVEREINRGGQAFILYNRVESIFTFAERVKAMLPNVRLSVIHGRMEEKVLEEKVLDFYQGRTDLLISTTIIENGIDLPRANTLVVIDADTMGLSTLYQLKGRVGRSDRLAYAYFTYKREKILSDAAFQRLNAIVEFAEMGSGIKIAMRDLEIRGAGNILGAEQHGHMDKIGYELYSKLLREELSGETETVPELDVRVTAYIPEDYIESTGARMDAYKEIAEINSVESEKECLSSLFDAYGDIPPETLGLIDIAVSKYLGMKLKVKNIIVNKEKTEIVFSDFKVFSGEKFRLAMDKFEDVIKISMAIEPKIEFVFSNCDNDLRLKKVKEFLSFAVYGKI